MSEPSATFRTLFPKYQPSADYAEVLSHAYNITRRVRMNEDRTRMLAVEVHADFDTVAEDEILWSIEEECRELYELESFRIFPRYNSRMFHISHMRYIAAEAARSGAVTNGFFDCAEYDDDGATITVYIPYLDMGVNLVKHANTETLLERILVSRYDMVRVFKICPHPNAAEKTAARQAALDSLLAEYQQHAQAAAAAQESATATKAEPEKPQHPVRRANVLFPDEPQWENPEDGIWKTGHMTFSTTDASPVLGEAFDLSHPSSISDLGNGNSKAVLLGEIFALETKDNRDKTKITVTIGITDGIYSVYLKRTFVPDELDWFKGLKTGKSIAVLCRPYRDKYDGEMLATPNAIMSIKRVLRMDKSEEKRTELHLHTTMSQMDAYIDPADLVSTAVRWGWKSIAVTDHGNVQAFPEVMLAKEKQKADDLKILWGMEAYYVNDKARALYGTKLPRFDDEMIAFDIETTGLDNRTCKITEIGAVKIKGGEVIDTFQTFVDPEMPIPEEIVKLTSITDEMVMGAPSQSDAVRAFLDFAGERMLIAHNANFDCGFIRVAATNAGIPFENTYLDTVALSQFVNPELKKHKLNIVAEHYGLGDFEHHRADADAKMLAMIFREMMNRLTAEGIDSFEGVTEAMSESSDPLKIKSHHMIIFAKNLTGLKDLYKLISYSYLNCFKGVPRIPRSVLEQHREGLIIGSACEAGELFRAILDNRPDAVIEEIADFYDYLEIQPICNNRFLIAQGTVADEEGLRELNRRIVALGKKLGKPVVATCDAHFMNKEDELYRKIVMTGKKFDDADRDVGIYLRTTEEMLAEFTYLGEDVAREVVIENPNKIAEMCEVFRPIPEGTYTPKMEGAEEELTESCWRRATDWYGYDDGTGIKIPEIVEQRLSRELDSIIKHGFAVLYMIAVRLVAYSESLGYLVGSRGSVGSSFVASMSGISEVNPLPPHYRCPNCKHSEFFTDGTVGSGFDLPDAVCPKCGTPYYADGHDIPFETFLGFKGDKSPDIDLNFSGDVQGRVHKYTEELFGEGNVFRAGTIATLADKTAYGYVMHYLDEKQISLPRAEVDQIVTRTAGVKRTTGQHPGGIIVIPRDKDVYDFTPIQHPADKAESDIITTHFQFSYLHDTILKLDELGHDIPTKYKMLERYTDTSVLDVKMNDPRVYQLFESTKPLGITPEDIGGCELGTYGLPEMGTHFIQSVLIDAKPKNFADLLQISGLTHGTDVWLGNAQDLIKAGICDISKVIGTRDGIMLDLIRYGLPNGDAFKIMESVRKGKGLTKEWEELMTSNGVPDWYIASCKKIKYMFPKAHAAAYVMSAIRLGWYKIHYPMEFYAAFLSAAPGGFDAEIVIKGRAHVRHVIDETNKKAPGDLTQKDRELVSTLQLVEESLARGVQYLPPSLTHSDYKYFLPENGKIRMPFTALGGLGETAAQKIVEVRDAGEIYSIEDLRQRAGLSKTVIEILRNVHALDGLNETNQFTFF